MTIPDIRETLTAVRDSVPVPPVDQVAFRARVRGARRRRVAVRAIGVGTAAAVLAAVVTVAPRLVDADGQQVAAQSAAPRIPVAVGGQVRLLGDDGELTGSGSTGTIVGTVDGDVVTLDAGVLSGPGDSRTSGVVAAYASSAGVTYQSDDLSITLPDGRTAPADDPLVAAGDAGWVTQHDRVLTVHGPAGDHVLRLGSDGSRSQPGTVEVGGAIVAVTADGTVGLYDVSGARRAGFLGGVTGAISPDGATYAYAANAEERAAGMRPGLVLHDVATGTTRGVSLGQDAVDLAWHDGRLLVLTEEGTSRTLWECDVLACRSLVTAADGDLSLR
ncbi:hypothetical protein [Nocardioides currus]|uniref:Lipoprotein LpqB beta-propeller domain-containing protein n=1 Tax=Nocardioides currus TaxID=2133958 RepID=A0A2R7YRG8_9ACTN|nr:hypothetical protein [Nocardioides currus]PUA79000.1 hypothetical protein C7S10_21210 [Nocardioides currus]